MHSSAWLGLYYSIIKLNGRTADPSCAGSTHDLTWWRATLYVAACRWAAAGRPAKWAFIGRPASSVHPCMAWSPTPCALGSAQGKELQLSGGWSRSIGRWACGLPAHRAPGPELNYSKLRLECARPLEYVYRKPPPPIVCLAPTVYVPVDVECSALLDCFLSNSKTQFNIWKSRP